MCPRQLAVVHGLVMNRTQQIVHRQEVFKQRCCRASYGLLVHEVYDQARHTGEDPHKDPLTGKVWALNQIDWLIRKVATKNRAWFTDALTLPLLGYASPREQHQEDVPQKFHDGQ